MIPYDLIPKNKFDFSGLKRLELLNDAEIQPLIPALLEWLQDANWPVAEPVAQILSAHQSIVEPHLPCLLLPESEDELWKYWIIEALLPKFSSKLSAPLLSAIRRIAESPTKRETEEEVDQRAREFLARSPLL